jgi:hypothetical protein
MMSTTGAIEMTSDAGKTAGTGDGTDAGVSGGGCAEGADGIGVGAVGAGGRVDIFRAIHDGLRVITDTSGVHTLTASAS